MERTQKKLQSWKKAIVHFLLCFAVGFFTGFAPTGKSSILSSHVVVSTKSEFSPQPVEISIHQNLNRSLSDETHVEMPMQSNEAEHTQILEEESEEHDLGNMNPRKLIIIVTPTSAKDRLRGLLLMRLANTLMLVPSPLLWLVVEQQSDSSQVSEILRKTGVMYRHLVFEENFTDQEIEMDHQRNLALNHIEHHRLSGIVHFAGLENVYDLRFFNEIRATEVFGTWPMAFVSANRKTVKIEGPVCDSSEVIGWHFKRKDNVTAAAAAGSPLHISSFAFNSSILWDPERWGRPSSAQDTTSQKKSIAFVEKEVLEEETRLKGIPEEGCSKIMVWNLRMPTKTQLNYYNTSSSQASQSNSRAYMQS